MAKKRFKPKDKHKQDLAAQIEDPNAYGVRTEPRTQKKRRRAEEEGDEAIPAALSGRILKEARAQQQELDLEELEEAQGTAAAHISSGALAAAMQQLADSDSDADDGGDADGMWGDDDFDVGPEEEAALAAFMAPAAAAAAGGAAAGQRSLADLIVSKIREQQQEQGLQVLPQEGEEPVVPQGLDDQVVAVYRGVGALLAKYNGAGKVPKAFKIIPSLRNWEEVLYLTNPEAWSPHAMYAATKIFVSNLNARLSQRFLALVLLPRVRSDILTHQRLHFALFQALKKATYKPGAFYKGLLLPLCASGTCSLREAVIFSSVLRRSSLPVLHSAAALLRLAQMPYAGTTSFFIRVLLDKKYALPYKVVDALVEHFVAFADDERSMPVVWHQSLLCFVQRYKHEIKEGDKPRLRALCSEQHHYQVTPEVLRELDLAAARGQKGAAAPLATLQQVAVGQHVAEDVRNLPPVPMDDE